MASDTLQLCEVHRAKLWVGGVRRKTEGTEEARDTWSKQQINAF